MGERFPLGNSPLLAKSACPHGRKFSLGRFTPSQISMAPCANVSFSPWSNQHDPMEECFLDVAKRLTPRLNEGHFASRKACLRNSPLDRGLENVCNMLVCGYALELQCSLLHHVSDEVIFDLNVLRVVMKYWIVRNLDTTLIITIYEGHL